jgi:hypothetical protein
MPRPRVAVWIGLLVAPAAGCGSGEVDPATAARLRALANLYVDCAASPRQKGAGPAGEAEFRRYLKGVQPDIASAHGLDPKNPAEALVSPRTGEPFGVVYGLGIGGLSPKGGPVVAYEASGPRRAVVYLNAKVESVTEAELEALLAGGPK